MHGDGFLPEQVAHRVERVRPHVRHRTAPVTVVTARIGLSDILREYRDEAAQLAELAVASAGDHLDRARFVVEAIGDHQLGAALLLRGDDLFGFGDAGRHRLFEQDVDARFERRNRVLQMEKVRRRDIDGVDLARLEQFVILFVRPCLDTVEFGEVVRLDRIARDQRREFRIVGATDARHERLLRDLATADDGIAHLLLVSEHIGPSV
ncbi:hypothetical protein QP150_01725 [Sphingomonas sp. 22L2VL55-3]